MIISYKWLSQYLPAEIPPAALSEILTSVGLEVEKMEAYEEVKGGLEGLFIGHVLHTEQHPNADKLRLTKVDTGKEEPLQIVCGAPNVAPGQKVVVATVGTTIYPLGGEPLTMKVAKIRGVESYGMICAEDEIGLGTSHAGIMVLPDDAPVGLPAAAYFNPYSDIIYHIGLTPNRMDAMSHWGVARDVCAYLSHHQQPAAPVIDEKEFSVDNNDAKIEVIVENKTACRRYSGVCISGIEVTSSPSWLQHKLKAIGLRPINNIVDITNYIQHETGQPLHAFDYDAITGKKIVVKNLEEGSLFTTLDEKERKLSSEDLMICNAEEPMCIAGVFGGLKSGVTENTKNIFLESAWFDPVSIRRSSFRHGLRTDAATRFEKGTDISATVKVLKRAAAFIKEIAGGKIASDIIDIYDHPAQKEKLRLEFGFVKKLSGKAYAPVAIRNILQSLQFEIAGEDETGLDVLVPFHKPDIAHPADLVEEILRIDGLDNIPIPSSITITPSVEDNYAAEELKEKISQAFTGLGYSEILTNSITNSAYFSEEELSRAVKLLNNLSSELDILRPSMLHTALEVIAFNLNRKNRHLRFFEFGKTYSTSGTGNYNENNRFCLYITGDVALNSWNQKGQPADIYYLKGIATSLLELLGMNEGNFSEKESPYLQDALAIETGKVSLLLGRVNKALADRFDLKQPVYYLDLDWDRVLSHSGGRISFREIPKFPAVERDLAMVVPAAMQYNEVEKLIASLRLNKLRDLRLFDVFESEKLGAGKKSLAISLTFMDEEKTLTDKEIDSWMNRIMNTLEKELQAEIRKQ